MENKPHALLRWDFGPFFHTFFFKSWRFRGPLLWTLIFSSFHRFSIGYKSGEWLGHSSSFIFFLWNQLRVSLAVCLVIVLLKCPPSFHLQHPGRWQHIFIKNVSVHFSIHPSISYMKYASTVCWKTASHQDVPTSKLHCWFGVFGAMCSHFSSKHGVYYGI